VWSGKQEVRLEGDVQWATSWRFGGELGNPSGSEQLPEMLEIPKEMRKEQKRKRKKRMRLEQASLSSFFPQEEKLRLKKRPTE
jgi:hypothetical protein